MIIMIMYSNNNYHVFIMAPAAVQRVVQVREDLDAEATANLLADQGALLEQVGDEPRVPGHVLLLLV